MVRSGACLVVLLSSLAHGQTPNPDAQQPMTAAAVMARVAANQDRTEKLRREYVYQQHIHVTTRRTSGKLVREETADYQVVPAADGTKKELQTLVGRYWSKGHYVEFRGEPVPDADSMDAGLILQFRDDLGTDKTKDGLARDLFPLTTDRQEKYEFQLKGVDRIEGRPVYRVGFQPKDKEDLLWAGEAYVDMADFEPVYVFTKLSRRIPFLVRTMLGTDLPGVGYSVRYRRQEDGVWFPTTYGTEFRVHVLFFLNRQITVSLENKDFEHTHVRTRIEYQTPE